MSIASNIRGLLGSIPDHVKLVVVTKTVGLSQMLEVYKHGLRDFGENRAVDLVEKQALLPQDIRWHYIGHLQRNKVRLILPHVDLIHSVDSLKLFEEIEREASKIQKQVQVLLQFHIADEETKYGLDLEEAVALIEGSAYRSTRSVVITGVMGMATFTSDMGKVRKEFQHLHEIFSILRSRYFTEGESFKDISMGMSGDYPIAIEEGSTMIRVGSAVFEEEDIL